MPTPRTWLPRIEEILFTIRAATSECYSRQEIEKLFEIQRRTALLLMNQVGAEKRHGHYVVKRGDLLAWVEEIERTEAQEVERRKRALDQIDRDAEQWRAVRSFAHQNEKELIEFPIVDAISRTEFSSLPETIKLGPGELVIEFDPEDPTSLCEQLYALSMALVNDQLGFDKLMKKAAADRTADSSLNAY